MALGAGKFAEGFKHRHRREDNRPHLPYARLLPSLLPIRFRLEKAKIWKSGSLALNTQKLGEFRNICCND
jgi:hypothetical protein